MSHDNQARALSERLATVYSRMIGVAVFNLINACLMIAVINEILLSRISLIWLMAIFLLCAMRVFAYFRYRSDRYKDEHYKRWETISIMFSLCGGILWGLGPILPVGDFSGHLWIWAFVIGGMCAGATSLHAAHVRSALFFTFPACLPLAVSLLIKENVEGLAAGTMVVAFLVTTTFTAILFSREFGRSLEMKYKLEFRAVELDTSNTRLSREIEDHRSTSEALYQSQKMEALGNLTGGFAHDFNNLLTVIIGNLDRIVGGTGQKDAKELARSAISAAESGASLTSRLLAFARKQALAPKLANINDVVADFRTLLMPAISGSIRVAFSISPQDAMAHIDAAHFQAALLNLVVNARDAMPDGGLITISTANVLLDGENPAEAAFHDGAFVAVAVEDNGEGMPAETLERAFEPFFTTKIGRGGTGLGLSQVYGFARQSGGFVRIMSMPGEGTRATLFIPAGTDAADADAPIDSIADIPAPTPSPTRALSVLIVDDNAAVLRTIGAGLSDHGWTVASASDGRTALDMVERGGSFDIVVTDIDMPGELDGLKLANALRRIRPALPILLISGAPIPTQRMDDDLPFLTKPFRKHVLIEKIGEIVARPGLDASRKG